MPTTPQFVSPGAIAGDRFRETLLSTVARQEEQRRAEAAEQLKREQFVAQQAQQAEAAARAQATSDRADQQIAMQRGGYDAARLTDAQGRNPVGTLAGRMSESDRGHLAPFMQTTLDSREGRLDAAGGVTMQEVPGETTFAGTPAQQHQQQSLTDAGLSPEQMARANVFMQTGDTAGLRDVLSSAGGTGGAPGTSILYRQNPVTANVESKNLLDPQPTWTPHQGEIPEGADVFRQAQTSAQRSFGKWVTMADGSQRLVDVLDPASQGLHLPGALSASLESEIASFKTADTLLGRMADAYDEDLIGSFQGRFNKIRTILFGEKGSERGISPDFLRAPEGAGEFYADAANLKNTMIRAITGAQMSENEAARIVAQLPTSDTSEDYFAGALRSSQNALREQIKNAYEVSTGVAQPISPEQIGKMIDAHMQGKPVAIGPSTTPALGDGDDTGSLFREIFGAQ